MLALGRRRRAPPGQRARRRAAAARRPPLRPAAPAAAARPARRRPGVGAHHGDRADPDLVGRGRPRAGRAPRGPRARQRGPAHPLRAAHRLPGRDRRAPARRGRGPRRRRSPGSRRSTPATRRTTGSRFFLFHRARRWNDERGRVDGLGAQARQDRGVQPPAARRRRHQLRPCRSATPEVLPQRPLLHHARQRHPPAPRRRAPADRRDRAPAQPPALRSRARPRGRGLRDPPAAGQRDDGQRRRLAVRARLRRPHRRRPLHHRGLRHLPGPVRRGQLHRQGALRRRRLQPPRSRAACPRTRCSRTTCSRGCTRAARWSRTSRSWTTSPRACWPTRAASTAGCAATGRSCSGCCRWCRRRAASSAAACRSSAAGRSSTTCAAAWWRPRWSALLVSAWTWLPGSPLGWTLAALAVLGFPLLPPLVHFARGPRPQQPLGRVPARRLARSSRPPARRCCSRSRCSPTTPARCCTPSC